MSRKFFHLGCEQVAFSYNGRVAKGAIFDPSLVVLNNGTIPKAQDPIICGSCGAYCTSLDLHPEDA